MSLEDFAIHELQAEIVSREKLKKAEPIVNYFYRVGDKDFRQLYEQGYEDPCGDRHLASSGKVVRILKLQNNIGLRDRLISAGYNEGLVDVAVERGDTQALLQMLSKIK